MKCCGSAVIRRLIGLPTAPTCARFSWNKHGTPRWLFNVGNARRKVVRELCLDTFFCYVSERNEDLCANTVFCVILYFTLYKYISIWIWKRSVRPPSRSLQSSSRLLVEINNCGENSALSKLLYSLFRLWKYDVSHPKREHDICLNSEIL